MRVNAVESDKKLMYPRKNFQLLAKDGFLGLIVPKELGGMGENHVAAAMAVETIARYGCPSTAMCYTMHLGAVAAALFRHHNSKPIQDIMRRIDNDCSGRHAVLFRSRDRLAFLVSDFLRRRRNQGWLEGAQESLLDHLRRLCRLVHHPDDIAQLRRQLLRPLLLPDPWQ